LIREGKVDVKERIGGEFEEAIRQMRIEEKREQVERDLLEKRMKKNVISDKEYVIRNLNVTQSTTKQKI